MEATASQLNKKVETLEAELAAVRSSKEGSQMVTMKLEDLRAILGEAVTIKQEEIQREVKKAVVDIFEEYMPKLVEAICK